MPQIMKLLVPPTFCDLVADPVYRVYVKRLPVLPVNVRHGYPWAVYAQRHPNVSGAKWAGKMHTTYADAFRQAVDLLKKVNDDGVKIWVDAAVVSRRTLIGPPVGFRWDTGRFSWCGRCRRPSLFTHVETHHGLRNAPALATENIERCYYCGAREIFASRGFRPIRKEKVST